MASSDALQHLEGKPLAHYRIGSVLGQGGMGLVYAAQDTRLGREVALKVLPPGMASEPERLERFRREARAVAALSHPNIVTVYSIEEADGLHFMALELVRGKTLASLIPPEGLALERWLEFALPLAGALGAAHKARILHRDLKPSNVMLSEAGQVKVLDFGLAKLWEETPLAEAPGGAEAAQAPPESSPLSRSSLTSTGRLLGTLPYMSPEQLRGQPPDPRSDLYSLGVVLYEMAAGGRPFDQGTQARLLEAICQGKFQPLAQRRPDLPPRLARLVERCLAVDPAQRYQSADELQLELSGLRREVARAARRKALRPVAAVLAVAMSIAAWFGGQSLWQSWHRFNLSFRDNIALVTWPSFERGAHLSPDGRQISFISDRDGPEEVWLTDPNGNDTRKLESTAGLRVLRSIWSPDGRELACVVWKSEGEGVSLEIVPASGGPARTLGGAQFLRPTHQLIRWIGNRLYLFDWDGLWRYDLKAQSAEVLFRCGAKEAILGVDVLEDQSAMITSLNRNGQENLWFGALDGQNLRQLTHDAATKRTPQWIDSSGRWAMFFRNESSTSSLRAISTATGEERDLLSETEACTLEDVGSGGALVLRTCHAKSSHVYTVLGGSEEIQRTADVLDDFLPSVALPGRKIAFQRPQRQRSIWDFDSETQNLLVSPLDSERFDFGASVMAQGILPRLSPDGRWLAFLQHGSAADRAESVALWDLHVAGMQAPRSPDLVSPRHALFDANLIPTYFYAENIVWSRDSSSLYHAAQLAPPAIEIRRLEPSAGRSTPIVRVDQAAQVFRLALAPDDRRLAFGLVFGGSFPGADRRWELRLWDGGSPQGSTISAEPLQGEAPPPLLLGWSGPQSLLLLRQQQPGSDEVATELREIDLAGVARTLLSVPDAHNPGMAVWDATTRCVYMGRKQNGVVNLYRLAVGTGQWQAVTRNRIPGVIYSGICPLGGEGVLFVRQQLESNVSLLRLR